jgi:hypothetical protein
MNSKNFGTNIGEALDYNNLMNNTNNTIAKMFRYGDKYKVVVKDVYKRDDESIESFKNYLRNRAYDISNDIDKLLHIKNQLAVVSWSENLEVLVDIAKYLQGCHHFISPSHVVDFFENPLNFETQITMLVDGYLKDYDEDYNKLEDNI